MIFFTRMLDQESGGQQTDDVITFDKFTVLIEQEAAVKVAIPCDTMSA